MVWNREYSYHSLVVDRSFSGGGGGRLTEIQNLCHLGKTIRKACTQRLMDPIALGNSPYDQGW